MPLPAWMRSRDTYDIRPPRDGGGTWRMCPGARARQQLLRRALGNLAHLLEEMLANETIARREGLLQMVDARAKVHRAARADGHRHAVAPPAYALPRLCACACCWRCSPACRRGACRASGWRCRSFPRRSCSPRCSISSPRAIRCVTLWHFSRPHIGHWRGAAELNDHRCRSAGRAAVSCCARRSA